MRRLLITGGTGYLGNVLVHRAAAQGWQTAASYYSQMPAVEAATVWLPLDVRDADAVTDACIAFHPEVVIHTAFRQYDPHLWAVTAEGAGHVAAAAQAVGARLIHLSSDVIFDGEREGAYTEADPPNPITPYGAAKAEAERLVGEHHPDAVMVRTSLIYGFAPIDPRTQFVLDLAEGRRDDHLFLDEYRCPIFVDDLAEALLELALHDYRGVINIAGEERLSRYEFGVLLTEALGRNPAQIKSGLSSESATRRPRNCTLDIQLARSLLRTPLRGVRNVLVNYP